MRTKHQHQGSAAGGQQPDPAADLGHNQAHGPRPTVQWQTPHLDRPAADCDAVHQDAPDLDLVETAFVDGFLAAGDATSFLRLASIPFEINPPDGVRLVLLRVEIDAAADLGSVTPHLGGRSFRYEPLPGSLVSRRRRLRFVYFDGTGLRPLSFADLRALVR
jgi:hypothetical protein